MSAKHPSLKGPPANLIGGVWEPLDGAGIASKNPARPEETIWQGRGVMDHIGRAVASARSAFCEWSGSGRERRVEVLHRFQDLCKARQKQIGDLICDETGKVLWDASAEAALLAAKVDITLDDSAGAPLGRVTGYDVPLGATRTGKAWFRPHGVMAVLGPYNFPAHLPNGHIVPALAMGNTVVFKPSDKAPAVGQLLAELFQEALEREGAPPGVFNLVQGGADIASSLVRHEGINGVLFTGSWPVGRKIMEANLDRPDRVLALEMGGNNPAVVMPDADLHQALVECVRCAFITTGQRCTCTRRIIVHDAVAKTFVPAFCKAASSLIVGDPRATHPVFMGPIISDQARRAVFEFQGVLAEAGGEVLVESTPVDLPGSGWYLTPSVVKVNGFSMSDSPGDAGSDLEIFGPLVRLCVVDSLDDAIVQANASRYGLAASIFAKDRRTVERFLNECRAGCVNVNTGTAGASSKLPFGGLGLSGNHRPAGAFSLDYCAYPVAGMLETGDTSTLASGMRIDESWLR